MVHSAYGRSQLVERLGVPAAKVHVIHHGAFVRPPTRPSMPRCPPSCADDGRPVVLLFGLLRPYKGLDTLLAAWRGIEDAQLWIVGRPR